jgi:hypothetical protein
MGNSVGPGAAGFGFLAILLEAVAYVHALPHNECVPVKRSKLWHRMICFRTDAAPPPGADPKPTGPHLTFPAP